MKKCQIFLPQERIHTTVICLKRWAAVGNAMKSCLKNGGVYIECDYMIPDEIENAQQIEEEFLAEYKRLSVVKPEGKYFHYDIPCTVLNQLEMFARSGFSDSRREYSAENTVIIKSIK